MTLKNNRVFIIAEIGVNHNGNLSIAKKLIIAAKKSGADAVKFQNFTAEKLVTINAKKAPYQIKNTKNNNSQFKMLKKLELKKENYFELSKFCKYHKIQFLSSVFDSESISFLDKKLKMIDLQLKKEKQDKDSGYEDSGLVNGEGYVVTDRNSLLEKLKNMDK